MQHRWQQVKNDEAKRNELNVKLSKTKDAGKAAELAQQIQQLNQTIARNTLGSK